MKYVKSTMLITTAAVMLSSCGGKAPILSVPIENIDTTPLKVTALTDDEKKTWGHKDLILDTIPGMSVDKAYAEIIKGNKGEKVIVAVIDSGIDIDHEDLDDVVWTNKKEKPNNGIDDDKNGYVDDIHGWNFLGDITYENMEKTRIIKTGNTSDPEYQKAKEERDMEYQRYSSVKTRYDQIGQQIEATGNYLKKHLKKDDFNKDDVYGIEVGGNEELGKHVAIAKQMFSTGGANNFSEVQEGFKGAQKQITDFLNYYLNTEFDGRTALGDDENDFTSKYYGDGNVKHKNEGESHGTHVAGIIAAERNNGKGVNGVANNVEIMAIRAVPDGDEYDKDVALAIRYAVDNGAQIINTSFGKYFSPHADKVRDAIAYAGKKNVLIVNAAGNEGENIDNKAVYPNDQVDNGPEVSDTFLTVGALTNKYGSSMIAGYSNYGKINVDVFAPGSAIYSTFPENNYKSIGGTSMASPGAAGVAALVMSQYPKLTAAQVKKILMESGLPVTIDVSAGGEVKPFGELTKSGKMVNAYNALILADKVSRGVVKI